VDSFPIIIEPFIFLSTPIDHTNNTLEVATSNSTDLFFYDPSDAAICFSYEATSIVFDPTFVSAQLPHETPASETFKTQKLQDTCW
jgi:hypothetical protein